MTFVDMKKVEEGIAARIMMFANRRPIDGIETSSVIYGMFYSRSSVQMTLLEADLPGWRYLSDRKKHARITKVITQLVKDDRLRTERRSRGKVMTKPGFGTEYLIPTNVLDKIVLALDRANG